MVRTNLPRRRGRALRLDFAAPRRDGVRPLLRPEDRRREVGAEVDLRFEVVLRRPAVAVARPP